MHKKELIALFLGIVFCFGSPVFADTVFLNSGEQIEGEIIEQTDEYVKIKVHGSYIIYVWDNIADIEIEQEEFIEEEPISIGIARGSNTRGYDSSGQAELNTQQQIRGYIEEIVRIEQVNSEIQRKAKLAAIEALEQNSLASLEQILISGQRKLEALSKRLQTMTVPVALDDNHDNILEVFRHCKLIYSTFPTDRKAAVNHVLQMRILEIEFWDGLADVCEAYDMIEAQTNRSRASILREDLEDRPDLLGIPPQLLGRLDAMTERYVDPNYRGW